MLKALKTPNQARKSSSKTIKINLLCADGTLIKFGNWPERLRNALEPTVKEAGMTIDA